MTKDSVCPMCEGLGKRVHFCAKIRRSQSEYAIKVLEGLKEKVIFLEWKPYVQALRGTDLDQAISDEKKRLQT